MSRCLRLLVHESQRERREVAAGEHLAARVGGDVDAGRVDRGQHVAAVVADEDAVPAGLAGDRSAPVVQALLEVEQRVGGALAEEHGDVEAPTLRDVVPRAVPLEELLHVRRTGDGQRAVGPEARRRALDERLVDRGRQRLGRQRGRGEGERPLGADDALRRDAAVEVVPGDLGGERVEDRLAVEAELLERAEELVPAAVAAADRAQPRVARSVLPHPALRRDQVDEGADVLALDVRVLDLGRATALAEPALVEGEHAVLRVEPLLERRRVRGARAAPAVAVQDHRHRLLGARAGGLEQRVADLHRLGRARIGDAGEAAVDDPGYACPRRPGRRSGGGRGQREGGDRHEGDERAGQSAGGHVTHNAAGTPSRSRVRDPAARPTVDAWASGTPSSRATTSTCSGRWPGARRWTWSTSTRRTTRATPSPTATTSAAATGWR